MSSSGSSAPEGSPTGELLTTHTVGQARLRLVVLATVTALLAAMGAYVVRSDRIGSPDFYSLLEMLGGLVALAAGLGLTGHYYALGHRFHLVVGMAFLLNGANDLARGGVQFLSDHGFSRPLGTPQQFLPAAHVSGRLALGTLLLLALLFRRTPRRPAAGRYALGAALAAALAGVALTAAAYGLRWPRLIYPGRFLSRPVDVAAAALLLVALAAFLSRYQRGRGVLTWWVLLSIAVAVVGEVLMAFSKLLYDTLFDAGHLCKLVGYVVPLLGMATYTAGVLMERRRTEERLEAVVAELRRSNEELEHFAGVASHDLQAPIRTMANYASLLTERYRDRLDAEALEFLGHIVESARRMLRLIDDLLSYARVGTQQRPFARVDCEQVLADVLATLGPDLRQAGAEVHHDPLPAVQGDGAQIRQLFQNLVSNAVKFRSRVPPRIHISAEGDGPMWRFSVRDNGVGLSSEQAAHIFELFNRAHADRAVPGLGIGLAICKRIIERHGGRIWVESAPGEGATFHFTLPRVAGAPGR